MATISNALLTFANGESLDDVLVTVTYTVSFDDLDRNTNLAYTEQIAMIGVDLLVGEDLRDDRLDLVDSVFSPAVLRADGDTTRTITRTATEPRTRFNEDANGADEVAALIALDPQPFPERVVLRTPAFIASF